jgi:hypothetical protein
MLLRSLLENNFTVNAIFKNVLAKFFMAPFNGTRMRGSKRRKNKNEEKYENENLWVDRMGIELHSASRCQ